VVAGADSRKGKLARLRAGGRDVVVEGAVRRIAVDDDQIRRAHEVADRLEARDRIVVHLAQVRIDDDRVAVDHQRVTVGRGARDRLIGDRGAATGAVLDDHRRPVRLVDLFAQEARKNIGTASRRKRHDDPDRACGLLRHSGHVIDREYRDDGERQERKSHHLESSSE
jgi:hypothetical protein